MDRVEKFRFWCHKVLPLVYDDSLSYYEFLCKVLKKLNEVIDNQNEIQEAYEEIIESLPDFAKKSDVTEAIAALEDEIEETYMKKGEGATKEYVDSVTDTQQLAIDALDSDKLDKDNSTGFKAYTHVGDVQTQTLISHAPTANAIPVYGTSGSLKVGAAISDGDATNKAQVLEMIGESGNVPPSTVGDAGKVLTVNDNGTAAWLENSGALPDAGPDDIGKMLMVGGDTEPTWGFPTTYATITQLNTGVAEAKSYADGKHILIEVDYDGTSWSSADTWSNIISKYQSGVPIYFKYQGWFHVPVETYYNDGIHTLVCKYMVLPDSNDHFKKYKIEFTSNACSITLMGEI